MSKRRYWPEYCCRGCGLEPSRDSYFLQVCDGFRICFDCVDLAGECVAEHRSSVRTKKAERAKRFGELLRDGAWFEAHKYHQARHRQREMSAI